MNTVSANMLSHGLSYLHSSVANVIALAIASCCGRDPGRIRDEASHCAASCSVAFRPTLVVFAYSAIGNSRLGWRGVPDLSSLSYSPK